MSHFITNTKNLEGMPIFSLPIKEISMPRIKKYIRLSTGEQKQSYHKQQKLLNNICVRLQKEEFDQIHKQNIRQMDQKFQKLKKKLYKSMQKQSVEKIFNSHLENQRLNIREIAKIRPQIIELEKKYGNYILLKMENFREASQISKMKAQYRQWYNTKKNNRTNSPVFKKMAYLLQRATKEDILDELSLIKPKQVFNSEKSPNQQNFRHTFEKSVFLSTSPYKKRQLDWHSKKQKISVHNPLYEF